MWNAPVASVLVIANGLFVAGWKADMSFSIRRNLSSILSIASASAGLAEKLDVGTPIDLLRRSELFTHSTPALAQNAQGLPPSHFVLRRRHVSHADPELNRRALLVLKTERDRSDTTLYTQSIHDSLQCEHGRWPLHCLLRRRHGSHVRTSGRLSERTRRL